MLDLRPALEIEDQQFLMYVNRSSLVAPQTLLHISVFPVIPK